jgi:hypothetical protein
MPGSSAFIVPFETIQYNFPTTPGTDWFRAVPTRASTAAMGYPVVTGIAECTALELLTPPTLRTAYSIYHLSIPWAADATINPPATTYVGNILAEIALLVNGLVQFVGNDSQPAVGIQGDPGVYRASGVISADLINPIRLNPRERLSLRLGTALSAPATVNVANTIQIGVSAIAVSTALASTEGTISYEILDLPGSRQL